MAKRIDDTNKAIIRALSDGRRPYSAIAEELGITVPLVKYRLRQAKRQLKELL